MYLIQPLQALQVVKIFEVDQIWIVHVLLLLLEVLGQQLSLDEIELLWLACLLDLLNELAEGLHSGHEFLLVEEEGFIHLVLKLLYILPHAHVVS